MVKNGKFRATVFIEGSNIYFAQKKMGEWLDWVKVKRFLEINYEVVEIRYYAGVRKRDPKMRKFLRKLERIGFRVVTKPVKKIIDETGRELEKANFDVEITGDILTLMDKFDIAVLFSGDSDFEYLVKILHKNDKKLFVYSSKKTLSWELKLKADKCFLLENFKILTKGRKFVKL